MTRLLHRLARALHRWTCGQWGHSWELYATWSQPHESSGRCKWSNRCRRCGFERVVVETPAPPAGKEE